MRRPGGVTLVEVLVVVAVLAIVAAILLPVFGNAKRSGVELACMKRLSQIYMALEMYGADYPGFEAVHENAPVPNAAMSFPPVLVPYLGAPDMGSLEMIHCPAAPDCAKKVLGSTYVWSALPPRDSPLFSSAQQQLAERFADPAFGYPLVHCLVHDELHYYPRERHLAEALNDPYVIRLLPDGSVRRGRYDIHRGHDIARACAQ